MFEAEGIETELIQVGTKDVRGCIACGKCREAGKCVFNDLVLPAFRMVSNWWSLKEGATV